MSILNIQTAAPTGLASVNPEVIYILTSDAYATVTATGYLTAQAQQGFTFNNQQMALVYTSDDGPVWLKVKITYSGASILNTVVSLVAPSIPGSVTLPTIANHLMVSTDTVGTLANLTGTAINNGSLQAGLSGTAGTLISYPGTASKGSLIVSATANTGNTNTTITNAAMGQATAVTIPDPGASTAKFLLDTGTSTMAAGSQLVLAKVNGSEASNAVTASGNAGVITTSSLSTAGGGTYAITWTNTKITSTSVLGFCIQGGTNTTQNITFTCVPGSGTATLTIYNNTASTALNGSIFIGYTVL